MKNTCLGTACCCAITSAGRGGGLYPGRRRRVGTFAKLGALETHSRELDMPLHTLSALYASSTTDMPRAGHTSVHEARAYRDERGDGGSSMRCCASRAYPPRGTSNVYSKSQELEHGRVLPTPQLLERLSCSVFTDVRIAVSQNSTAAAGILPRAYHH